MLIDSSVSVGASSRPEVTALATCHTDTVSTRSGQRAHTAHAVATIAVTASAKADPAGSATRGSGSNEHASVVNAARSGPARASNRRSHPRTVEAGRPINTAIRR